jgi:hypothetical protein
MEDYNNVMRVRGELEVAVAVALRDAAESAAAAEEMMHMRCEAAPCHHLDLKALQNSTKYRYTHAQLALLSREELAMLLNDRDVSYECPLHAQRARCE